MKIHPEYLSKPNSAHMTGKQTDRRTDTQTNADKHNAT